jgi:hypothetical protein
VEDVSRQCNVLETSEMCILFLDIQDVVDETITLSRKTPVTRF